MAALFCFVSSCLIKLPFRFVPFSTLEAAVADAAPPEEDHPPPHLPHQKTNHLFLGSQCDCIVYYCDVYHTILFPDEIISVLQYLLSLIEDFLDDQIVQ